MDEDSDDDFDFEEMRRKWQAARKTEFDFDEWAKEIDGHPAFMTSMPEGGVLSDEAAALQALKYDTEDDAELQATAYKNDGNKNFELKKYRWAIDAYTAGIKVKCADKKLNAILYANRGACNFRLGNIRSALKDCVLARKFDPSHLKARIRGIECLLKLNQPEEALSWINDLQTEFGSDPTLKERNLDDLKKEAMKLAKTKARDERKARLAADATRNEKATLLNALKKRHIRFRDRINFDDPDNFDWSKIEVSLPGEERMTRVRFDASLEDVLVWPVLFLYPEFGQTDFIREFQETEKFLDHLDVMFSTPPPWDVERTYNVDTIEIYFESRTRPDVLLKVPLEMTLGQILSHSEYLVTNGLPSFLVYSKSAASRDHLSKFSLSSI